MSKEIVRLEIQDPVIKKVVNKSLADQKLAMQSMA